MRLDGYAMLLGLKIVSSAEKLRPRLKLNSMRYKQMFTWQRTKMFWLERMEEKVWASKCRKFKISGSFQRGRPRKTWTEVIRSDLKEEKVSQEPDNDRNA